MSWQQSNNTAFVRSAN